MEWYIMNCDGVSSLSNNLGTLDGDKYTISEDCYESLVEMLENLEKDESSQQTVRRQMAITHMLQKDLVPLIIESGDDLEIFHIAIKLLVNLTQPMECLQESVKVKVEGHEALSLQSCDWFMDVSNMLHEAKTACTNHRFTEAIFTEIRKIIADKGEYDLVEEDSNSINQCLLLMRNLLHIRENLTQGQMSHTHLLFLKMLFQSGIDKILINLLNLDQKDYWGVTVIQVVSLLYKDVVSEIYMTMDDADSYCDEDSCDSSNCSQCEMKMDRALFVDLDSAYSQSSSYHSGSRSNSISRSISSHGGSSFNDEQGTVINVKCLVTSNDGYKGEMDVTYEDSVSPYISTQFTDWCRLSDSLDYGRQSISMESVDMTTKTSEMSKGLDAFSLPGGMDPGTKSRNTEAFTVQEFGLCMTEFTCMFIQQGFSSLVQVLKHVLLRHKTTPATLDDSYFLWSVAFFLKFARRKEIEFKYIRDVFTTEVFGFLVYEAISNSESIITLHKAGKSCDIQARRLHLTVSALRELMKTMSFHRDRALPQHDAVYIHRLETDLANMRDLRQTFLLLIRKFDEDCHTLLYLRDLIVTNHYFLLLLEEWIAKGYCLDKETSMLSHVKQFGTTKVMEKYGFLLQNFEKNDHHVNNCIFTMMHHTAGDCQQIETLLQEGILQTFIQIWDTDTDLQITQEMNDLMEYVIQRFLSTAEKDPMSLAKQLYKDKQQPTVEEQREEEGIADSDWTTEEEDKLVMWYSELESSSNMLTKIVKQFADISITKTKLEIVNQLFNLGWLSPEELESFAATDPDLIHILESPKQQKGDNSSIAILTELSKVETDKVVPYCVDKLVEGGLNSQVHYIQANLLEAAYAKMDEELTDKKFVEEPVIKYHTDKGYDIPLVFYNEDQEKMIGNLYMTVLLEQLGFRLAEEVDLVYPKMPNDWTIQDCIEKAKLLGEINTDEVKFDVQAAEKAGYGMTKDEYTDKMTPDISYDQMPTTKAVPRAMWMQIVDQYNVRTKDTAPQLGHIANNMSYQNMYVGGEDNNME